MGWKQEFRAIHENCACYTISQKGRHGWARSVKNIFNFTAPLIARNRHVD